MRSRSTLLLLAVVSSAAVAACGHAAAPPPAAPRSAAPAPKAADAVPTYGAADVDRALRSAWAKSGLVPAPRADDATFLRRVTLDVTGTIPTPDAVNAFLASGDPDKRAKVVAELVASPAWADHWASYWDEVLLGRGRTGQQVDRAAFRGWLHDRFAAHQPWDAFVRDLVSATGQNGGEPEGDAPVNGAVNWTLRFRDAPQDLAGNASRVFLGVQIQCAQCHDHKTEPWKQTDFQSFANAFLRARIQPIDLRKGMGPKRLAVFDDDRVAPRFGKMEDIAPVAKAKPRGLDGKELEAGKDARRSVAAWMTAKENPWFAKAIVNRMWGHFLGRGFSDPVDDMRPSNPTVLPEVLDGLAKDFAVHGYDLGRLVRTLCATEAYQLAASASAKTDTENTLWARFHLVPLDAEELLNAVLRATRIDQAAERAGVAKVDQLRAQLDKQVGFLFDIDEEDDTPNYEGTVSQALALLNGGLVGHGARAVPGSALAEVLAPGGSDADKIDRLALQILSRRPTEAERAAWVAYVQDPARPSAPPPTGVVARGAPRRGDGPLARLVGKDRASGGDPKRAAYEDLVWAWLNSSEFVFNH